ncbi:MAG: hypothetical protein WC483_05290 [Candidatus Paceibacterota bacterium]
MDARRPRITPRITPRKKSRIRLTGPMALWLFLRVGGGRRRRRPLIPLPRQDAEEGSFR